MFIKCKVFILIFLAMPLSAMAQPSSQLIKDNILLSEKAADFNIEITLISTVVNPSEIIYDAAPGQFPKVFRVVRSIKIKVNGQPIVVPYSAYADLIWVLSAEIKNMKSKASLTISGGDGSESYVTIIEFDNEAVRSRTVFSGMTPNEPLEKTQYYLRELN